MTKQPEPSESNPDIPVPDIERTAAILGVLLVAHLPVLIYAIFFLEK